MSFIPGLGIAKGMALTLRRFFAPKATIQYPETAPDVAVRFRGRLQLLYDEWGNLKCETCFQCAQACPVECIDMGGFDTKGRFHVHWGAAEQYAERREESALRRSGRPVPDPAYTHFDADRHGRRSTRSSTKYDYDHEADAARSSRRSRPSTATCPWPRSSASARSPARRTRSSTARPATTATSASRSRGHDGRASASAPSCLLAGAGRIARTPRPTELGHARSAGRPRPPGGVGPASQLPAPHPRARPRRSSRSTASRHDRSTARRGRPRPGRRDARAGQRREAWHDRRRRSSPTPARFPRAAAAGEPARQTRSDLDAAVGGGAFTALRDARSSELTPEGVHRRP